MKVITFQETQPEFESAVTNLLSKEEFMIYNAELNIKESPSCVVSSLI